MGIQEVYVWIGIHADGREMVLFADLPNDKVGLAPLFSSHRHLAEKLLPVAQHIVAGGTERFARIEMRTFTASAT